MLTSRLLQKLYLKELHCLLGHPLKLCGIYNKCCTLGQVCLTPESPILKETAAAIKTHFT